MKPAKDLIDMTQKETTMILDPKSFQIVSDMQIDNLVPNLEEPIFKDIQISPIRNLESSFEGVKDNGGDFLDLDFEGESSFSQDGDDELRLIALAGTQDKRTLEMTLSLQTKAKVGEKKKRGAKSNKAKLETAGNAVGQSKLNEDPIMECHGLQCP